MSNPFTHADDNARSVMENMRFMKGTVSNVPNVDGLPHVVGVKPRGKDTTFPALVSVFSIGDANIPDEGTPVTLGYLEGGMYFVVSVRYTTDEGTPNPPTNSSDERYIGHHNSDAYVRFHEDGSVTVVNDNGTEITLDGDNVILGNGGTSVITDIETTTDSDGHVTSVDPVRSSVVEVE